ncbi:MAG: hypothetical protein KVP17_005024 [Porospora cf. gigantea B]|uniref:uncharacterized protein n=2 Tax=Porospora cf. gigantea B TaxID=2853592 RepID=UPI003571AE13|nr:MAG: hypothetical protein KVP17_005024 [Porospora cf. gigantea B]
MTMMLRTLATKSPPFALLPLQGGDPWKAVADFVDLDVLTPLSRLAKEVCCVYPADDFWTESMGRMRQSRSGVTHTNTPRISRRTAPVIPCVSEVFPFIVVEATLGLSRLDLLLEGYGDSGPVHGRFPAYVQFSGDAVSSVTLTWTSANCLLPSVTPSADEYEIGPGVRLTWRTASIIDNSAEIVELSLVVQAGPVPNTSQWLDLLKSKGITDQPDNSDLFMCLTLRRAVYWTVKWLDMLNRSSQLEKCGQVQVVSRSFGRLEVAWRPPDLHVFTNRPPILLELTSAAQVYVAPPPVVCFPFHVPVPYTFLDLASETPFKRSLNLEQSKLPWTPLLPTVPGTSPAQVARLLGIEPGKNRGLYQWRLDFVVWRIAEWPVVLSEKHSQHLNCITNTKGSFWAGFSHLAMTYELHSSIHQSTTVSPEYVTTRQRFLGHLAGSAFSAELGRALLILNLSTFLSAQILLLFHSLPASGGLETAVTVYVLPKTGAMGERQEQLLSILKTLARHLSWRPNTDGPIRGHQAKDATCSVLIPPGCLYRDFMFEFFSALTTWFNAVMLSTYEGHWKSPTDLVIDGHCPLSVELKHFAAAYPTTTDWPTAKNDTPEEDAPFSQHAREMWLVSGLNLIHSMMTASAATSSSSAVSSWGDKPSVVNLSREPPGFFIYELINPTNPSTGTPASKRRRVTALPPLLPLCAVKGGQRFLLAPYLGLQFRCERQEAYVLTALQYFSMLHHRLPRGDFRLLPRLMCHHPQMMEALRPVLDMNLRSFLAHKDYIVNSHTGAEATQPSCPFIELQTDDGDQADKMELLMKGVTSSPCSLTLVEVRIWAMAPFQAAKTDKTFSRLPLRLSLAQTHNGLGIDSVEVCGVSLKTYLERFGASLTKPLDSLCEVFLDASKVSEALTLLASMVTK